MSYLESPEGLSYVAPGARTIAKRVAAPPRLGVTPTAPGSRYMSYGPGLRDRSHYMYGAIPFGGIEGNQPQASYDVGGGLGNVVVQASPAGASTGPPRAPEVTVVAESPSPLPRLLALGIAGAAVRAVLMKRKDIFPVEF